MTASPAFLSTDLSSKRLSDEDEEIDRENIMNDLGGFYKLPLMDFCILAEQISLALDKIGCTSAIEASFIAFGLHYLSEGA